MHNPDFKNIDWHKDERGNFGFPESCNFYGSISSVFSATRTQSSTAGLQYWFNGLVYELGLKDAIDEKNRTLSRGRLIDATTEQVTDGDFDFLDCGFFAGLDVDSCSEINENTGKKFDWRVVQYFCETGIDVLALEIPVWSHEHKIKGRVDYVGVTQDSEIIIVDNKGGNKEKRVDQIQDNLQQITTYFVCLEEMIRNAKSGKDQDAFRLLDQAGFLGSIKGVDLEPMFDAKKVSGRIVRFVDGDKQPQEFNVHPDEENKLLNTGWRFKQVQRRLKKFYSYPLVILEEAEGFFRARWKRVPPSKIFQPDDFKTKLEQEVQERQNERVVVRFSKIKQ